MFLVTLSLLYSCVAGGIAPLLFHNLSVTEELSGECNNILEQDSRLGGFGVLHPQKSAEGIFN